MVIELIARGVLIGPRGVLVCRNVGMDYVYLPGGHVEFGEPAAAALEREMMEELGLKARASLFLGVLESAFTQAGKQHHELNLMFQLTSPVISRRARFTPAESQLEFFWQSIGALVEVNLLPAPLLTLIPSWAQGGLASLTSDMRS